MNTNNLPTLPFLDTRVYQAIRSDDGRMLPYVHQSNNPINFVELNITYVPVSTKSKMTSEYVTNADRKTNQYFVSTWNELSDDEECAFLVCRGVEIRRKTEEERMQPIIVQGDPTPEEMAEIRLKALSRNAVREPFLLIIPHHPKFMVDAMLSHAPDTAILSSDEAQPHHDAAVEEAFQAVEDRVRREMDASGSAQ